MFSWLGRIIAAFTFGFLIGISILGVLYITTYFVANKLHMPEPPAVVMVVAFPMIAIFFALCGVTSYWFGKPLPVKKMWKRQINR